MELPCAVALAPAAPPPATFSGFLSPASLVECLIQVSEEMTSVGILPPLQTRNVSSVIRRVKLLSSLFEELRETGRPFPPSSVLCLTELLSAFRGAKALLEECATGSALWGLLQTEVMSEKFHAVAREIGKALDILPLGLLDVTADVREHVELLKRQARTAAVFVDPQESRLREKLLHVLAVDHRADGESDGRVEEIAWRVGLRSSSDCDEEMVRLEAEVGKQAGTGGVVAVSNIKTLICLVSYWKSVLLHRRAGDGAEQRPATSTSSSSSSFSSSSCVPDEFRCPITLELMRDPVIVASGHTYERGSIARWINSGHHTCPKSGQRLIHMALIPNYALKGLIHQWCQENSVPSSSPPSDPLGSHCATVDHISAVKPAVEAVRMTAEFLVGKLATGSPDTQRQAAYELRLLAKSGMNNRWIIAEAGAIPFLVTLLASGDPRTQENAVTALLNLSIFHYNKLLIASAGAVDGVVGVLRAAGASMEARENAAATLFSLSMVDELKAAIGSRSGAIPGLLELLREGSASGKRDAATALHNLAMFVGNRAKLVAAGAVPLLLELLMDDRAGITDDALALLALVLSGGGEAWKELAGDASVVLPMLVELLRVGTPRGKENAVSVLLGLCRNNGGEEMSKRLWRNPRGVPSLHGLACDGSPKAKRKAEALLRLLHRHCSLPSQEP